MTGLPSLSRVVAIVMPTQSGKSCTGGLDIGAGTGSTASSTMMRSQSVRLVGFGVRACAQRTCECLLPPSSTTAAYAIPGEPSGPSEIELQRPTSSPPCSIVLAPSSTTWVAQVPPTLAAYFSEPLVL